MTRLSRRLCVRLAIAGTLAVLPIEASADTATCLDEAALPRVVRVLSADGEGVYARVIAHADGVPTEVSPLAATSVPLSEVFDRASEPPGSNAPIWIWKIPESERSTRVCSPVRLPIRAIDDETRVVVAAGLNYAAHAEEAGGGDVFLFPKPVEPTSPYSWVAPPEGVTLLDYEIELAYVLLADIDLTNLPTEETFLANTAFFVANDMTDREAIIERAEFSGPGPGFVEAKGQPSFLPAGPWMVRGTELFAALEECGADGFGLRLEVDEGTGFLTRQEATTSVMIVKPRELLEKIRTEIESSGIHTTMPVERKEGVRYYPFATQATESTAPILPAGSIILTGTPEGISMQTPSVPGVVVRGLLRLRGPFEQFRREEVARAAQGAPGGYLDVGERVRARIDGLGTQIFRISEPGSQIPTDLCDPNP